MGGKNMEEKRGEEAQVKGIELHCNCCNAGLNTQESFSYGKNSWQCAECGYKNTLAPNNILVSEARYGALGRLYGWFRSVVLYFILYLVDQHILQDDYIISGTWLGDNIVIVFVGVVVIYVLLDVLSMVMEERITHCCANKSLAAYVIVTPFLYLWEDFIRPFVEFVKSLKSIFTQHGRPAFLVQNIICCLAYAALLAAIVFFGLRLLIYIAWIGL